jgi:Fe-Mn family superoxide dismutase
VAKLNELIEGSPYVGRSLDEVVTRSAKDPAAKAIFNNAAQAWNHDFYWRSMRPKGGGTPGSTLRVAIERDIGGLTEFNKAFAEPAAGEFGSGWAWLVVGKDGKLKIATTDDAKRENARPLPAPAQALEPRFLGRRSSSHVSPAQRA